MDAYAHDSSGSEYEASDGSDTSLGGYHSADASSASSDSGSAASYAMSVAPAKPTFMLNTSKRAYAVTIDKMLFAGTAGAVHTLVHTNADGRKFTARGQVIKRAKAGYEHELLAEKHAMQWVADHGGCFFLMIATDLLPGLPYYIMPRASCDAFEGLEAIRADPRLTIALPQQLMQGMRFLHERGVVHGDIKLENILRMITPAGGSPVFKLADLAFAKAIGTPGPIEGTPNCLPPEYVQFMQVSTRTHTHAHESITHAHTRA